VKAELTLPLEIVDLIADRVIEKLKPCLFSNGRHDPQDTIFTPETLAEYLHVDTSWVYKQVSNRAIPFYSDPFL
jgi:hypothetical protein